MNRVWTVLVFITAVLAVWLGSLLNNQNRTAEKFADSIKYREMDKKLKALVLGGSGAVGRGIVKALAESPQFEKVTLFGRREIELPNSKENPNYLKFDHKMIDFEDLSNHREAFRGYDVGFSALGIPSTAPNYYRVCHDYAVETAKLAKDGGVKNFHFVSASGADKTSWFNARRIKGEAEEEISQVDFDRVTFYRPAIVLTDKKDSSRWMYNALQSIDRVIDPWNLASVESDILGKVIVQNTFQDTKGKIQILENSIINRLGKEMTATSKSIQHN